jgi:hypothetical protein
MAAMIGPAQRQVGSARNRRPRGGSHILRLGSPLYRSHFAAVVTIALAGTLRSSAPVEDAIAFANLKGEAIVVLDGKRGSLCWRDHILSATGSLGLGGTIMKTSSCPTEVDVFTTDAGLALDKNPAWSHDPARPLTVSLPAMRAIGLNVVLVVSANASADKLWVEAAISEANTFFAENRVGIQVAESGFTVANAAQAGTIGNGCESVGNIVKSNLYDSNSINVYFLPWIEMLNYGQWLGYNCYRKNAAGLTAPDILFVSLLYGAPTTLTHELGHALGLRWLNGHTNPGEQSGRKDFPVTNLMYSYVARETAAAQNRFSLGQAYRMNIDTASWLNRGVQPSISNKVRKCQPDPTTQVPCPRLALDLTSP